MNRSASTWRARVALFALTAVAISIAGCNIVAPAFYLLHGPPRTPAAYELEDRPTIVFVDDRANVIDRNSEYLRRRIADTASRILMQKELVMVTIRPQDALALAKRNDRHREVMPVDAIGRAVGAEQIIYVQMLKFKETPDGVTPRPIAAAQVKVLDVINRTRLFPPAEEMDAYPLNVEMPPVNTENYASMDSRTVILEMLADQTGVELAKLFYEHETKELGGNLDPR
jgi:hypothetical protein